MFLRRPQPHGHPHASDGRLSSLHSQRTAARTSSLWGMGRDDDADTPGLTSRHAAPISSGVTSIFTGGKKNAASRNRTRVTRSSMSLGRPAWRR